MTAAPPVRNLSVMHTNRRRLARVLASVTVLLVPTVTAIAAERPSPAVETVAAPVAYSGPSRPSLAVQLQDAADRFGAAVRATLAAQQPKPTPPSGKRPQVHVDPDPATLADGDRFDRLATCESHQNPTDLSPGGTYRGAFQFSIPTWHAAGMTGDPIDFTYAEQKAAAMSWSTQADPYSQWPVCWRRTA